MRQRFNKTILFDNISFLLKERGKKIGDLESEAGVSVGYISRTKEGETKPGIDFIMGVAESLDVSVDALLKIDISNIASTDLYLIEFLMKLSNDTFHNKLDWQVETKDYLNYRLERDDSGNVSHPLFSEETFYEKGETEYPEEVTRTTFTSRSYDVNTLIDGDCFNLQMKDGMLLYIMKIRKSSYTRRDSNINAIEVWISSQKVGNQFLCGTIDTPQLTDYIYLLYKVLEDYARHPKVKQEIKDVIDSYMNYGIEEEIDTNDKCVKKEGE